MTPTASPRGPVARATVHAITVAAPSSTVYDLVADVAAWPTVFGPTVHAEVLERRATDAGAEELMRIWALAHDRVRTWTSRRSLEASTRCVSFQQVVSAPPVASMSGEWCITEIDENTCRVLLSHWFRAVDDAPDAEALIEQAVDRNSTAELAALKQAAELDAPAAGLRFSFSDSVTTTGPAGAAYSFLARADQWPRRLPHVARLELTESEEDPGVQRVDMDTRGPDGGVHNTVSLRVCMEDRGTIIYKQVRMPPVLRAHTGRWVVDELGDGRITITSWHTVMLDSGGVRDALGPDATVGQARSLVREALGANSSVTLRHAARFAEDARARA